MQHKRVKTEAEPASRVSGCCGTHAPGQGRGPAPSSGAAGGGPRGPGRARGGERGAKARLQGQEGPLAAAARAAAAAPRSLAWPPARAPGALGPRGAALAAAAPQRRAQGCGGELEEALFGFVVSAGSSSKGCRGFEELGSGARLAAGEARAATPGREEESAGAALRPAPAREEEEELLRGKRRGRRSRAASRPEEEQRLSPQRLGWLESQQGWLDRARGSRGLEKKDARETLVGSAAVGAAVAGGALASAGGEQTTRWLWPWKRRRRSFLMQVAVT